MSNLSHFNSQGDAIMVDVTTKEITSRQAIAKGKINVASHTIKAIKEKAITKGDVLTIAQLAGIMAAKQTATLIPLCHPLALSSCQITFEIDAEKSYIEATCCVKVAHQTGVEMEALMGVNLALLTIYDMCKAIDKEMVIDQVHLVYKSGGKSGVYEHHD